MLIISLLIALFSTELASVNNDKHVQSIICIVTHPRYSITLIQSLILRQWSETNSEHGLIKNCILLNLIIFKKKVTDNTGK